MCFVALLLGSLALQPPPKEARVGPGSVRLPPKVLLLMPEDAPPQAQYAAEVLRRDLGRLGVKIEVAQQVEGKASPAIRLSVEPEVAPPEGFVLEVREGPSVSVVGADGSGLLYGCLTLSEVALDGEGSLPCPLRIRDWPTMRTRGFTGFVRDLSPRSLRILDWLARWRINAGYYEIYGDQGQDSVPEIVSRIAHEAERRGITLYGCVSNWRTERYLGEPLCPSNPEHVKLVRRLFEELAQHGCKGLIFLFDDIPQESVEHPLRCEACRRRFGDLAGMHLFWLRLMTEVGRKYGIKRFLMCPTPYYRRWKKSYRGKLDGVAYFRRLGPEAQRLGVQVFHCCYKSRKIEELRASGLREFVWWYNGLYPFRYTAEHVLHIILPLGPWEGFRQLEFGWHNVAWDEQRGVVPLEGVWEELRSLPRRTRHAWLCSWGYDGWALWGIYTWRPERFDPEGAREAVVESIIGKGSAEPYLKWERITRKWLVASVGGRLFRRWWGSLEGRERLRREISEDTANLREALESLPPPEASLLSPAEAERCRQKMAATLEWLVGTPCVELGPLRKFRRGNMWRWERRMSLSNLRICYSLRYAICEEGGKFHRCRWHFGSGLGMTGPSHRNWYDAGFIDVEVNGRSLDCSRAEFEIVEGRKILGRWETDDAVVSLLLSLRRDDGLDIEGRIEPKGEIASAEVKLWCIPSAGWGSWADMDKRMLTPLREVRHGRKVALDLTKERWLVFYDANYDAGRELPERIYGRTRAEGPCGLLLYPEGLRSAEVEVGRYIVTVTLRLDPRAEKFHLAVWDFHGLKNSEVLSAWRQGPPK